MQLGHLLKLIKVVILWIPLVSFAAEYQLFDKDGLPNADYNNIVARLKKQDVLSFSNGEKFSMDSILGNGNTTLILGGAFLDNPKKKVALRIPLFQGYFDVLRKVDYQERRKFLARNDIKSLKKQNYLLKARSSLSYSDYLNSTMMTHKSFEELGAPILPVIRKRKNEYIATSILQGKPTTGEILTLNEFMKKFTQLQKSTPEATAALKTLTKKLARVNNIGDFSLRQIAYDFKTNEWFLIDWIGYPSRTKGFSIFKSKDHPLIYSIRQYNPGLAKGLEIIMNSEKVRLRYKSSKDRSCTKFIQNLIFGI